MSEQWLIGQGGELIGKGNKRNFWGDENILLLNTIAQRHQTEPFEIYIFYCMLLTR